MIITFHFNNCYESTNITPLPTQINASKFKSVSQDPLKKRFLCSVWLKNHSNHGVHNKHLQYLQTNIYSGYIMQDQV